MSLLIYAVPAGHDDGPLEIRSTVSEAPDPTVPAVEPVPAETERAARDKRLTGGLQPHNVASYVHEFPPQQELAGEDLTGVQALDSERPTRGIHPGMIRDGRNRRAIVAVEGIQPAYTDTRFGGMYFEAGTRAIQGGTRTDVTGPRVPDSDPSTLAASAAAKRAARGAAYESFLNLR